MNIYYRKFCIIFQCLLAYNLVNAQYQPPEEKKNWQECSPLPEKMSPVTGVINKKIYAAKGSDDFKNPGCIYEYDPEIDTWKKKADMPVSKHSFQSFVLHNKLYTIGGISVISDTERTESTTLEEYDPATDRWTKKAPMKTGRTGIAIIVYKDKVYAFGGGIAGGTETKSVEVYDPATDSWETKAEMPTGKSWASVCCINDRFYLFKNNVEEYDPANDKWTLKAPLPHRNYCLGIVVKSYIYTLFLGGLNSHTEKYDPVTDTWTPLAAPVFKSYDYAFVTTGNTLITIGGFYGDTKNVLESVYSYNINQNIWRRLPDLSYGRVGMAVEIIDNSIYVMGGQFGWYFGVKPIHFTDAVEKFDLSNTIEIHAVLGKNKIVESPTSIALDENEKNAKFSETPSWLNPHFKSIDKQQVVNRINTEGLKKGIYKAHVKMISGDPKDEDNYSVVLNIHEPLPAQIVQNLKKGLKYEYYENTSFITLPDFTSMKPKKTGITESINLLFKDRDTLFSAVYSGYINIAETEVYTFSLTSDDGSKLYIDDKLLINNDGLHGTIKKSENCALEKGFHKIRIEYMQSRQGAALNLNCVINGIESEKKIYTEKEFYFQ